MIQNVTCDYPQSSPLLSLHTAVHDAITV